MGEPCPTCGHAPQPSPVDWLTPPDQALAEFLSARYAEDRAVLEAAVDAAHGTDAWVLTVRMADHVTALQGLVEGFRWTADAQTRAIHRRALLMVVQPFEGHPDFDPAWLVELLGDRS